MNVQYDLFAELDFEVCSPLAERVMCMLGTFSLPQKKLVTRLTEMGADCKPSTKVSRNVHYVLVGDNAPADQLDYLQQLAFHGYMPRVLRQSDLDAILQGHYSGYEVPLQIRKDLHLTLQHYLSARPTLQPGSNPFYTRELFIASDMQTPLPQLYQALGDRGVYANPYIDDTTDILVVSDASIERLRCGETDDTLRYIEQQYNESRSQTYRYVMLSESELTAWLRG